MSDNFYRAFEDRFRGSRELIKSRLMVYLPFIAPLLQYYPKSQAIDLGCGRGEWLELLMGHGFDAQGVDLDEDMLLACTELGLAVTKYDAIAFLEELPEASQVLVSGFHIVEHLPFDEVKKFVNEAIRVLKPGGLLILETPNPENLVVGSSSFYLDPTHERPLPPLLLAFVPEYSGFERVKILRLQESSELANSDALSLLSVLNGASPDYAVVSQKAGPIELQNATYAAFDSEYGLSMETLANRFQKQSEERELATKQQLQSALEVAQQAQALALQSEEHELATKQQLQSALEVARQSEAMIVGLKLINEKNSQELQVVLQQNHNHWMLAEDRQRQIQVIFNSRSWRITRPLRSIGFRIKSLMRWMKSQLKSFIRHGTLFINQRPHLRAAAKATLNRFPVFKKRIKTLVGELGAPSNASLTLLNEGGVESLNPRAKKIYDDLKTATTQKEAGR